MIFLAPHRIALPTARRLKEELGNCLILRQTNSRFDWNRFGSGPVINWGRSDIPTHTPREVINKPRSIRLAADKERFLLRCAYRDIPAPRLLDNDECMDLLKDGKKVLIREPNSFGGRGITVVRSPDAFNRIPPGKIAVRFFPKEAEYRAHVWQNRVILLTQKRARRDTTRSDDQRFIWNHTNGWVHCREDVDKPEGIDQLAIDAVNVCNLDFGAVDIMLNKDGVLRVLEVNTAPGIEGQALAAYSEAILNTIGRN
jgi:glutathione synthase/RimK-type ligase-like ATP-grasp enzyme